MDSAGLLSVLESDLEKLQLIKINGRVVQVVGLVAESQGPDVRVGDLCRIRFRDGSHGLDAEVVGFRGERVLLMPLGDLREVGPGSDVLSMDRPLGVAVSEGLLGRILDGLGEPMDDKGPLAATDFYPLYAEPPHPLRRQMVENPFP
jgi:flagellum-specific ATP synthase